MFIGMGTIMKEAIVDSEGKSRMKRWLPLGMTADERMCSGAHYAAFFASMVKYMDDPALLEAMTVFTATSSYDLDADQQAALARLLPENTGVESLQIPGLASSVTGAYAVETADGTRYAFAARPYGYANEVMELWYMLDENGAIVTMRAKELILHSEYFSNYTLDEGSYKEGFTGLTEASYTGEQALIAGATMSSEAVDTATRDVFEAFRLANAN